MKTYVSSFLKELPINSGDNIRQGRHIRKSPISLENFTLPTRKKSFEKTRKKQN